VEAKMKLYKIIIIIILIYIFIIPNNLFAQKNISLKYICSIVYKEMQKYKLFPANGWLGMNEILQKKYGIKIPKKYMIEVQTYYISLVIDNLKNSEITTFTEFEQAHPLPLGIRKFAKEYYEKKYGRTIKIEKEKSFDEATPKKKIDNIELNKLFNEVWNKEEQKVEEQKEIKEEKKDDYIERKRLFEIMSQQTYQEIPKINISNITNPLALYNKNEIKDSLIKTKESVETLNNLLENAIRQIDLNYDIKLQEVVKKGGELNNKLLNYADVMNKFRMMFYNFFKQSLNIDFQLPADIENINLSINKISLYLDNIIDDYLRSKSENKNLREEVEKLRKENYQLKQELEEYKTKAERSRYYDLRLKNLREQELRY